MFELGLIDTVPIFKSQLASLSLQDKAMLYFLTILPSRPNFASNFKLSFGDSHRKSHGQSVVRPISTKLNQACLSYVHCLCGGWELCYAGPHSRCPLGFPSLLYAFMMNWIFGIIASLIFSSVHHNLNLHNSTLRQARLSKCVKYCNCLKGFYCNESQAHPHKLYWGK